MSVDQLIAEGAVLWCAGALQVEPRARADRTSPYMHGALLRAPAAGWLHGSLCELMTLGIVAGDVDGVMGLSKRLLLRLLGDLLQSDS